VKARFLLDENMSPHLRAGIRARLPQLDIIRVGDTGAPPLETSDEAILLYLDRAGRILVTKNRASMPDHLQAHFAHGHRHWGILTVREGTRFQEIVEALELIEAASEAEEWINTIMWVPFD